MADQDHQEVVLLDFWPSMFCARVRIALAEKGIEYASKEENLPKKSSLLLQMNPVHKKVPVLIHNGKPVCESLVAVEYVDEFWKDGSPILPSDPYQRARAGFWADYIDKKMHDAGRRLVWGTEGEGQETAKKELEESLNLLERELGDKPYFGGEVFGYLDLVFIPFYSWFYTYESCGNFSMEVKWPGLVAWAERCVQKESVAKSIPEQSKIHEFVLEMKKSSGLTR